MTENAKGLRDIAVADSKLSYIDGKKGLLVYRGYAIEELAGNVGFEEAAYLLWHGYLPTKVDLQDLKASLRLTRPLEEPLRKILRALPKGAQPMSLLRTAVSAEGLLDQKGDIRSPARSPQIWRRRFSTRASFCTSITASTPRHSRRV